MKQLSKRLHLKDVEGKQKLKGLLTGTTWEIDAKGVSDVDGAIIVVECRRYRKPLTQEAVAAIAFRVQDVGAVGGITVSPLPLQKGAAIVAAAREIQHVTLNADSTIDQWAAQLGQIMHFGFTETAVVRPTSSLAMVVRNAAGDIIETVAI